MSFAIDSCYGLAIIYALCTLIAAIQIFRISLRAKSHGSCWKSTQQKLHIFVMIAGATRTILFCFMISWISTSEVPSPISIYFKTGWTYILTFLPALSFFTAFAVLANYWAEIYYRSINHVAYYQDWVRVLFSCSIGMSFVFIFGHLLIMEIFLGNKIDYMKRKEYNIIPEVYLGLLFFVMAIITTYFGRKTYNSIIQVPSDPTIRMNKLSEVTTLTIVCTIAFTLRAIYTTVFAVKDFQGQTNNITESSISSTFFYLLLEITPSGCILYYQRQMPPATRTLDIHLPLFDDFSDDDSENLIDI